MGSSYPVEGPGHACGVVVADPEDAVVLAEPRVLAAGELPGAGHRARDRLLLGDLAGQEGEDLLVAQRPARGRPLPQPLRLEPPHLVDEPRGPHAVHPFLDPLVELRSRTVEPDLDGVRVDVL